MKRNFSIARIVQSLMTSPLTLVSLIALSGVWVAEVVAQPARPAPRPARRAPAPRPAAPPAAPQRPVTPAAQTTAVPTVTPSPTSTSTVTPPPQVDPNCASVTDESQGNITGGNGQGQQADPAAVHGH